MCGIIGLIQKNQNTFYHTIIESLKQIQNRGYDSVGISYLNDKIKVSKFVSDDTDAIENLEKNYNRNNKANCILAHTRWATHGAKTIVNCHPHNSWDNKLSLVHNGIIENYLELKVFLENKNIPFKSQTDTEVISNLIQYYYLEFKDLQHAIKKSVSLMTGTWGLAIIHQDYPNHIFSIRCGSPILIGIEEDFIMITSEISGFAGKIKNYFVLENNDLADISIDNNKLYIKTNNIYDNKQINNTNFDLTPAPYEHWTMKEIMEQPEAILRAISFGGRIMNNNHIRLGGLDMNKNLLNKIDNIIILGCGTSLHAGFIGAEYFKSLCDFNVVIVKDGAEFNQDDIPLIGNTGVIYLSQSGETKDLHRCINIGKENNLFQIGVINVVDSLIAREVDCGCYINAGREVGVASTKSFTNQVILLSMIAIWFSQLKNINNIKREKCIKDLRNLSQDYKKSIQISLNNKELLKNFINKPSLFILGKSSSKFISQEGALKIKEICYIHAEGYGGSALKHGPFALLDENHPVILLCPNNKFYSKMMNVKEEVLSRNAPVLIITNNNNISFENKIILPTNDTYQDLLGIIPLQIASYYCSIDLGINCDKPRNLAKCVNVE